MTTEISEFWRRALTPWTEENARQEAAWLLEQLEKDKPAALRTRLAEAEGVIREMLNLAVDLDWDQDSGDRPSVAVNHARAFLEGSQEVSE